MDDSARDWSALQPELLGYITRFLPPLIEEFRAFRGVCTSWRAATAMDKVPLLMLAEKKGGSSVRELYSLSKRKNKIRDSMDSCVRDWSALPADVLGHMSKFVPLIEDFMALRGVCTSWRAAAAMDKFVSKVPLLMLAQKKGGNNVRDFYSLSKQKKCLRMAVPGAMGKKCINAGFGWIMTVASSGEVCLLKPFSAETIELPNFKTFPIYKKRQVNPPFLFFKEAVLTANPSETSNFTVLVATVHCVPGFWRNGSEKWAMINLGSSWEAITMVYFKGKLLTLDLTGHVLTWDPHGTDLTEPQGKVKVNGVPTFISLAQKQYLVGSTDGDLLIIERNNIGFPEYFDKGADHFGVKRVDLVKGECEEIKDLGKDAIFLGDNAAVAVDATEFPGVLKPNCIYFTDDCAVTYFHADGWFKGGGKDMGIYNVEDESIARFNVKSFSRICPPLWLFP